MEDTSTFACATAPKRNSLHWQNGSITWGELVDRVTHPKDTKECGGYLMGTLKKTQAHHNRSDESCLGIHRVKTGLVSRSMLCIDYDSGAKVSLFDLVDLNYDAAIVHTTFSSTPENPRLRVIIPLSREVSLPEWDALMASAVRTLGEEGLDHTCLRPVQFMYWPSTADETTYRSMINAGEPLDVDRFIGTNLVDKRDTARPSSKRDPKGLPGIAGAFNRVYDDWDDLFLTYKLPYTAVPDMPGRWTYADGDSVGGLHEIGGGFVFSHHDTDPASGVACSAWDLVRLHRYGDLDKDTSKNTPIVNRPSSKKMEELAYDDDLVAAELVESNKLDEDFDSIDDDELELVAIDTDWSIHLIRDTKTLEVKSCISNWDMIRDNDPVSKSLQYNAMSLAIEVSELPPWRHGDKSMVFSDADVQAFRNYIEREYRLNASYEAIERHVITTAHQHWVNPVVTYLDGLEWDGKPRLETCLPGVKPTDFSRMVARKSLCAAVARAYDPGVKWDHMLILFGKEGLGKTWWIEHMAKQEWYAPLGDPSSKDTLLTLQRAWIITSDEGVVLRKNDAEAQKEFLTRTADTFRKPYDRATESHKRHCVIWGTTNDEVFLRNQEGNRRFLIVHCSDYVDFNRFTDEVVDQIWAEAVQLYKSGSEKLFLNHEEMELANHECQKYTEEDSVAGIIQEWLDLPVPKNWEDMSTMARINWVANFQNGQEPAGGGQITRTCTRQLAIEAVGIKADHIRKSDLAEIGQALQHIPGWHREVVQTRLKGYGPQRAIVRDEDNR